MTSVDLNKRFPPNKLDKHIKIKILKNLKVIEKQGHSVSNTIISNIIITKDNKTINNIFNILKEHSKKSLVDNQLNKLISKILFDYIRVFC